MKYLYTLSVFLLFCTCIHAQQNGSAEGVVTDTALKQPIIMATVSLIKRTDSSLVSFTMTDAEGKFRFNGIANGDYRLLITHVSYHNSNLYFTIDATNKKINFPLLALTDITKQLDDITVSNEAPPITIKGDSIEYNAASFKTKPNAVVEDLLKKLPGVQVEKDGTIKAQGQTVNKVYVDGKDFFGNDPKIATKNLPADAVDKVQVFDKQSDMAQLTGFDDGNSEKAINLKLKKDKKKNTFGKITGGAGTGDRYENRLNINSFKDARQFTAIGLGNNTNAEGFSFMDLLKFSGGLTNVQSSGGSISINIADDNPNAALFGLAGNQDKSINTVWAGGLNYSNLIGKHSNFNGNYFYSHFNPNIESNLQRQYILPDSSYFYNQKSVADNENDNHRLNFVTDINIDSFTSLKIAPSFGLQRTQNNSHTNYSSFTPDGIVRNDGNNKYTSLANAFNFKNNLLFLRRFNKRGRTFSLGLENNHNQGKGQGNQNAFNNFYDEEGALQQKDSLNQMNFTQTSYNNYLIRAAWKEPVLRRSLLEISASNSSTTSDSYKKTYDYNNGKYDALNTLLSNDFKNKYNYTNESLRLRTQKKKYNYSLGATLQQSSLNGLVHYGLKDSAIQKQFHNLLPNALFQYNFTKFKNLNINYNTTASPPSISQLQPVADVSNPLHIQYGNPGLKPELGHRLQMNFVNVNPFKGRHIFMFAAFTQTSDKIIYTDSINDLFVQSSRPVNVNGVFNVTGDFSWGLPLRKIKGNMELSSRADLSKNKQFVNGVEGIIHELGMGPQLNITSVPNDKVDLSFTAGIDYTLTKYSLHPAYDIDYFTQHYETEFNWQLPKKFFISNTLRYTVNNKVNSGFNKNIWLWNAAMSKQFLKFNRGELRFSVKDLLNQNIGFSRSSNQSYIEDQQTKTLRRFFLLSFTYNLIKIGAGEGRDGGGIKIMAR